MWKFGLAAGALAMCLPTATAAFEWNGFQSGMTPEEVRNSAEEQGLALDREPDSAANVTVPLYAREGGETRGFVTLCQGQLARVGSALEDLDMARAARLVDDYAQYGDAQVRTMTTQTGARGLELFWAAESDEIGLTLIRLGDQQFMQETRADIGLWDLCATTGPEMDEEGVDDLDSVEDEEPPTPEELLLDALGRAMRGDDGDQ